MRTTTIDGGDRWRNRKGVRVAKGFGVIYGNNVTSAQLADVYLLGLRTVLRLKRDAWSLVKLVRQARTEYAPPPLLSILSKLSSNCKFASLSVNSKVQLTLHSTLPAPHGDSWLVQAVSAWSVKARRILCRHVEGCEGSWSYDLHPRVTEVHPLLRGGSVL